MPGAVYNRTDALRALVLAGREAAETAGPEVAEEVKAKKKGLR